MVRSLVLLPHSQFVCWSHSAMGASACRKRWWKCSLCPCYLSVSYIMLCMCPAEHMMCCQCSRPYTPCWTSSLNSQFLSCACVCTFCVMFCGLKSQSHSDNHLCMQLFPVLYVYLLILAAQCHAFLWLYASPQLWKTSPLSYWSGRD